MTNLNQKSTKVQISEPILHAQAPPSLSYPCWHRRSTAEEWHHSCAAPLRMWKLSPVDGRFSF